MMGPLQGCAVKGQEQEFRPSCLGWCSGSAPYDLSQVTKPPSGPQFLLSDLDMKMVLLPRVIVRIK